MFRQRDMFNILVYERSMRHRELYNKGKIIRLFFIGDLVVVSKEMN